jgi:N-acyl-D-aspartate/D-glutamate deacylase
MEKRGRLEKGFFADVVVFDPKTVNSPATYENPMMAPVGIRHVFRNGAEIGLS